MVGGGAFAPSPYHWWRARGRAGRCLLLYLEQRALAAFGVYAEFKVQLALLQHLHPVADPVVAAVWTLDPLLR